MPYDVLADGGDVWFTFAEPARLYHFAEPSLQWLAGLLRPATPLLLSPTHVHYSVPGLGVLRILR
jgi:hypothetical protein